jgi:flavodoxin
MKPLLVYQTRTQNTVRVAEVMAETLEGDLMLAHDVTAEILAGRSLIGLGSGVYWTRLDRAIYAVARQLPRSATVFTFATSGFQRKFFLNLYRSRIKKALDRCGVQSVAHWHCPGYDQHFLTRALGISRGRPDTHDLESARAFALDLKKKYLP